MVNDPIADFLTRIRNGISRKKSEVVLPSSKMLEAIAKIMKEEGFILDYSVEEVKPQNQLSVKLKYVNGKSAIEKMDRVSKPGVRNYLGYREIPRIKRGLGIAVFSTPNGVMTGATARDTKIGGEYLCKIW